MKYIAFVLVTLIIGGCATTAKSRMPASYDSGSAQTFEQLCLRSPKVLMDGDDVPKRPAPVKVEFKIVGDSSTVSNLICQYENVRVPEVQELYQDPQFKAICPHPGITNREGFPANPAVDSGTLQSSQYTHATGALTLWCYQGLQ